MRNRFYKFLLSLPLLCIAGMDGFAQNTPVLSATASAGSATVGHTTPGVLSSNNNTYNYTRSFVPKVPITDAGSVDESSPAAAVQQATTYLDGFDRPMFSIQRNFIQVNNVTKNLVQVQDTRAQAASYGYLPYTTTGWGFSATAFGEQKGYYQAMYPGEAESGFSMTRNTADDTSRSRTTYAPGLSQVRQGRGTKVKYGVNAANEVKIWTPNSTGTAVSGINYYPAGELWGETVTTSGGGEVTTYQDKAGRVVYRRELMTTTISGQNVVNTPGMTYYVYDTLGQLSYILPPRAVDEAQGGSIISSTALAGLCFSYVYDKGLPVMQRNPGKGWEYFVYDKRKRQVLYQDSLMKTRGQWSFTFYDSRNRPLTSGLLVSNATRDQMDVVVQNGTAYTTADWQYYIKNYELDHVYPPENLAGCTILTFSYYDDYRESDADGSKWDTYDLLALTPLQQNSAQELPRRSNRTWGQLTGSKMRILPSPEADPALTGDWRESAVFYDDKGRAIYTVGNDLYQGNLIHADHNAVQYDFNGKLVQSKHRVYNANSADPIQARTEYIQNEYDMMTGRLVAARHRTDDNGWQVLARYQYDGLGRVRKNILGDYGEVQDYDYNIRGQMTGINALYAETGNKEGESRTFGESLKYDYGFSQVRYDGKIAGMVWRGSGTANMYAYGYSYDKAGRLTTADFRRQYTGMLWENQNMDYSVSNLKYDLGGNILGMRQKGMGMENGSMAVVNLDRLAYSYNTGSNQLRAVKDTVVTDYGMGDFIDGNTSSTDYVYDPNGNLQSDANKGISSVVYNHLNKPVTITFSSGKKISNSYDAGGNKVQELVIADGTRRTDYISNYVYENDKVQFVQTPVGRTTFDAVTGLPKEEFFVKDHLGNVRSLIDLYTYPIDQYLAGYEVASANIENLFFERVDEVRDDKPGSTWNGDLKSARLNGGDPDRRIGTSLLMHVMAGDKVEMNVNNFYDGYNAADDAPLDPSTMLSSIVGTLTGGSGGYAGGEQHDVSLVDKMFNSTNYTAFDAQVKAGTDTSKPKAYLNYLLFDENMQLVSTMSGVFQANGNNNWTTIGTTHPILIPENGFLAVYLSNQTYTTNCLQCGDVFFDQLVVRMSRGNLKEESHYYPFGLPIAGMGSAAPGMKPNRRKYQGNEYIKDLRLNWMDFQARQYDPQLGRFLGVDPKAVVGGQEVYSPYAAMGNAPESMVDPNGELPVSMGVTPWVRPTPQIPVGNARNNGPGSDREADLAGGMMKLEMEARAAFMERQQKQDQEDQMRGTVAFDLTGNGVAAAGCDHSVTSPLEGASDPGGGQQSQQELAQTWYFMSRSVGAPHAAVYDPVGDVIYEVNHPRDKNGSEGNGLANWLEGILITMNSGYKFNTTKSVAYQWKRDNKKKWAEFWNREKGSTYLLSPVTVPNPGGATAWFQSRQGKTWDYNALTNNCAHYSVQGLITGRAFVLFVGPLPSSFTVAPTLKWVAGQPYPVSIR